MTRTFNWKIVIKTMGALLLIESFFMVLPSVVSLIYREYDSAAFLVSTALTFFAGVACVLVGRHAPKRVGEREGYLIVALVWIVFSIFGLMPFYFSGAIPSYTDAFFETMSGFSTTGATILSDIESLSHGCLFWRSLMQWIGGMGIIVLSIAILPMFGLGGMQLYAAEATGLSYEKLSPRIADTAKHLWGTYILLTAAETIILAMQHMPVFDAVCHSFSTIATGGFSPYNNSLIGQTPGIQYTVAVFTLLSGINFMLLILAVRGKVRRFLRDEETHWYLGAVMLFTAVLTVGLFLQNYTATGFGFQSDNAQVVTDLHGVLVGLEDSFRKAFSEVVFTMTSCGFAVDDYMMWRPTMWFIIFLVMFTGGCAGSTAGGVKWVRIVIFVKNALAECRRRIYPNAIIPAKLNNKPISQSMMNNVTAFIMFYIGIVVIGMLAFCAMGVDFVEALGASASAIGNIGPALGSYGPVGNYAAFPWLGKWVYAFIMVIGRLEIFTILLLFSPTLWKK